MDSPFISFPVKFTPPNSDPGDGSLWFVGANDDWLPFLLAALHALWDREAWVGDDDAVLLAQIRASQLFGVRRIVFMAGIEWAIDDASALVVRSTDATYSVTVDTVNNQLIVRGDGEGITIPLEVYGSSLVPVIVGKVANGSLASPTAIPANREILRVIGVGHDGGAFTNARAIIRIATSENWSGSATGTRIEFEVTPAGQTTRVQAMVLSGSGGAPGVGFLGATPVVRQNVTGSRGGNVALASLLTALASLGLITDSTTP